MVVLVVDFDEKSRKYLAKCIRKYRTDVKIIEFADANKALEYIKKHEVNILFTEINMSGVTGYTLAKKLKEEVSGAHVVFVTDTKDHAMYAWEAHINGYMVKPVDEESVRAELECVE